MERDHGKKKQVQYIDRMRFVENNIQSLHGEKDVPAPIGLCWLTLMFKPDLTVVFGEQE